MAEDNIKEIIANSKNMSLSDLGGALLSRSSKIRSQRESRSKRQEKVNKILAVLLGGQAIFQKVAQNRMKDLDGIAKRMQSGTKKQAKQLMEISTVLKDVDPTMLSNPNALEEYKKGGTFKKAFDTAIYTSYVVPHFTGLGEDVKAKFLESTTMGSKPEIMDKYGREVAEYFFTPNTIDSRSRAQVFMQAGNELFSGDKGFEVDEDVVSSFLNIDSSDLNRKITDKALQEVKAIGGELSWFNAPRLLVNSIFKNRETGEGVWKRTITDPETGEKIKVADKSRFSRISDGDINLQPPSLDIALRKIKLFDAMPNASEAIDILNGSTDWLEVGKKKYIENEQGDAPVGGTFHQAFRRVLFDEETQKLNNLDRGILEALDEHMFTDVTDIDKFGKDKLVSRWYGTIAMIQNDPELKAKLGITGNTTEKIQDQALIYLLKDKGVVQDKQARRFFFGKDDTWTWAGQNPEDVDNFNYSFEKIDAHLSPSFTINDNGNLQPTPPLKNQDDQTVVANSMALIRELQKANKADLTENMIVQVYNNPTNDPVINQFKEVITPKYPTALDFNDAIQNQGYENVYTTLIDTPMPTATTPTTTVSSDLTAKELRELGYFKAPETYTDPYASAKDIAAKGQTGVQVFGKAVIKAPAAIYSAGVRQVDRQAETLLERHFKGSVNATDQQLQQAMQRLNINSLEEARQKYSVE